MPLREVIELEAKKYCLLDENSIPVYTIEGEDKPGDLEGLTSRISEVSSGSAARRKEISDLKTELKKFEGIEDPVAAKTALKTVANYSDKQMVEAGEVERVKTEAIKVVESEYQDIIEKKYKPIVAERDKIKNQLVNEIISHKFNGSPFIKDMMRVPARMVRDTFGKNFSVDENNNVTARDDSGEEIYSTRNPGQRPILTKLSRSWPSAVPGAATSSNRKSFQRGGQRIPSSGPGRARSRSAAMRPRS